MSLDLERMFLLILMPASTSDNLRTLLSKVRKVTVNPLVHGAAHFVPEIYVVKSSPTATTPALHNGNFEVRYGFKGDFTKLLFKSDFSAAITVNIIAGTNKFTASASVAHMLAPGVIFRVGDESLTVSTVASNVVTFYPYAAHGVTSGNVYVSETLLGVASSAGLAFGTGNQVSINAGFIRNEILSVSATSTTDASFIQFQCATAGVGIVSDSFNDKVSDSSSSSVLTVVGATHSWNCAPDSGNNYNFAVYRQQSKLLPFDATEEDMEAALSGMASVGSVSVQRFGPTSSFGFSWSITFTSLKGTSRSCTGLGSGSECLQVFASTPMAVTISGESSTSGLNGVYISNGFKNGRPTYMQKHGLYAISFFNSGSWDVHLQSDSLALGKLTSS